MGGRFMDGLTLRGDYVAIERLPDAEMAGSIFIPATARDPESGPHVGRVVAIGPGDRLFRFWCHTHGGFTDRHEEAIAPIRMTNVGGGWSGPPVTPKGSMKCRTCGGELRMMTYDTVDVMRCSMEGVEIGSKVVYNRSPSGQFKLDGRMVTLVHLQQHVLAVLEAA